MTEFLNCQTPAGIEALRQNRIALKAIERQTGFEFLGISNDEPSRIDGFIHDPAKGIIVGSYEVKTRNYGLTKLQTTYGNRWMASVLWNPPPSQRRLGADGRDLQPQCIVGG